MHCDWLMLNEWQHQEVYICTIETEEQIVNSKQYRDLYDCFLWLSKSLDDNPTLFHDYNLEHQKKVRTTHKSILAEGAEFYIISYLMLNYKLICSQASRAMPGYDIVATDPLTPEKTAKIQVKYRSSQKVPNDKVWHKRRSKKSIKVNSLDFDFLIVVSDLRSFPEDMSLYETSEDSRFWEWKKKKFHHKKPSCWIMSHDDIEFGEIYLADSCFENWDVIEDFFIDKE